jgi:hypothetical protein
MSISEYLGIDLDYIVIGLAALVLILIILTLVNIVQMSKLKKKYKLFMGGENAKSLEDILMKRMNQIDGLVASNSKNERNIESIIKTLHFTYQKMGLVKYDAFREMGGKLSFSLAMLDEKNDGFIINAMHTREGCYTYIKEIIDGNSIITLAEEEKEALDIAKKSTE